MTYTWSQYPGGVWSPTFWQGLDERLYKGDDRGNLDWSGNKDDIRHSDRLFFIAYENVVRIAPELKFVIEIETRFEWVYTESVDASLMLSGMAILPGRRMLRGRSPDHLLPSRTLSLTGIEPASSTIIRHCRPSWVAYQASLLQTCDAMVAGYVLTLHGNTVKHRCNKR